MKNEQTIKYDKADETSIQEYMKLELEELEGLAENPNEIEIKEKPTKEVEDFANTIKDNPQEIIDWARSEIKCYNELIDIVRKKTKYANRNIQKKARL